MKAHEKGFGLIEMLVGILLASIMGAAVASNLGYSMRTGVRFELNYAANSLANSRVEYLAATNANDLDSSSVSTETGLTYPNLNTTFTRETTIDIDKNNDGIDDPDAPREVTVVVSTDAGSTMNLSVTRKTTFSRWQ